METVYCSQTHIPMILAWFNTRLVWNQPREGWPLEGRVSWDRRRVLFFGDQIETSWVRITLWTVFFFFFIISFFCFLLATQESITKTFVSLHPNRFSTFLFNRFIWVSIIVSFNLSFDTTESTVHMMQQWSSTTNKISLRKPLELTYHALLINFFFHSRNAPHICDHAHLEWRKVT